MAKQGINTQRAHDVPVIVSDAHKVNVHIMTDIVSSLM
jgi:hypothetical protein